MTPRKRRTNAPRAAKDAQAEEQTESPCLPPHDQEEPTAPSDPPLTHEETDIHTHAEAIPNVTQ
ncbi:hypothetical protein DPMN_059956 [Dreissena polymorpha]|uniref:Uncharacterized protein n=1 Tax=Dreissena polymorpha TaxID=45954 RepID=A0A9D4C4C3_DREPO|nr:hypothetical protein DPMN_059956 [Dreissena polymorpha]